MPQDVGADEVGSPDDGKGQPPPVTFLEPQHPYLGFGIDRKRCAACAAYPSVPCAVHIGPMP